MNNKLEMIMIKKNKIIIKMKNYYKMIQQKYKVVVV